MFDTQKLRQNEALRIAFQILVVSIGLLGLTANLYIRFHYAAVMPRSPQVEMGRIYAIPAQSGGIIYVNRAELDHRDFISNDLLVIFCVLMVLYFSVGTALGWWLPRHMRNRFLPDPPTHKLEKK